MPLVATIDHGIYGSTYLWSIQEDERYFADQLDNSGLDLSVVDGWHPKRQREWLSGRHLINSYLSDPIIKLKIGEAGKPYFDDSLTHFSISHSGKMIALTKSTLQVGLDIQVPITKMERLAHKFMNEEDYHLLDSSWSKDKKEHFVWSAKEAMFKSYGLGEVDFKKHLAISITKNESYSGQLDNDIAQRNYKLDYKVIGELHMVIAWDTSSADIKKA